MENLQTGKSTEMINKEIKFKSGLADDDFTTNSLMRTR
jgi:hypothetical protein